jgi:RNA-directed DNA polymerase
MLVIPTVIDRLLQQAISQWLSPKYEGDFSSPSYGFRPGRNAHQAVLQAQANLNEGYTWVIELDLEKFFEDFCAQSLNSDLFTTFHRMQYI